MKRFFHLLPCIVLTGTFAGSLPARADDAPARKTSADELLQVMHTQQMMERAADRISQTADRLMGLMHTSATPAEEAAFRESLRQQAGQMLKKELSWESIEPILAQSYADDFTEPELKQLIDFYKSPVGQKLLDKQPDLTTKLTMTTQDKVRAVMPMMTQKLRVSIQKFQADHPLKDTPAPAGGLAAPPGTGATGLPLLSPAPKAPGLAMPSGTAAVATPSPVPSPTSASPTPAGPK